jgi:hypothetical protein
VLHSDNRRETATAVTGAVQAAAWVVAALNAIPALFGGWRWYRGEPSRAFWVLLRVGQAAALLLAVGVALLAVAGHRSSDSLFYLYALLPIPVGFVAEQLRLASAQTILDQRGLADAKAVGELPKDEQRRVVLAIVRREMGVMALSALAVAFLAARAAGTAHGF